jgi:hypothetical protein
MVDGRSPYFADAMLVANPAAIVGLGETYCLIRLAPEAGTPELIWNSVG